MSAAFGEAWDRVFAPPVAHRGLWSADGPPENSLAAFEAACEAGYGIELDVQLSADGEASGRSSSFTCRSSNASTKS